VTNVLTIHSASQTHQFLSQFFEVPRLSATEFKNVTVPHSVQKLVLKNNKVITESNTYPHEGNHNKQIFYSKSRSSLFFKDNLPNLQHVTIDGVEITREFCNFLRTNSSLKTLALNADSILLSSDVTWYEICTSIAMSSTLESIVMNCIQSDDDPQKGLYPVYHLNHFQNTNNDSFSLLKNNFYAAEWFEALLKLKSLSKLEFKLEFSDCINFSYLICNYLAKRATPLEDLKIEVGKPTPNPNYSQPVPVFPESMTMKFQAVSTLCASLIQTMSSPLGKKIARLENGQEIFQIESTANSYVDRLHLVTDDVAFALFKSINSNGCRLKHLVIPVSHQDRSHYKLIGANTTLKSLTLEGNLDYIELARQLAQNNTLESVTINEVEVYNNIPVYSPMNLSRFSGTTLSVLNAVRLLLQENTTLKALDIHPLYKKDAQQQSLQYQPHLPTTASPFGSFGSFGGTTTITNPGSKPSSYLSTDILSGNSTPYMGLPAQPYSPQVIQKSNTTTTNKVDLDCQTLLEALRNGQFKVDTTVLLQERLRGFMLSLPSLS
jgi:hypothetical protein